MAALYMKDISIGHTVFAVQDIDDEIRETYYERTEMGQRLLGIAQGVRERPEEVRMVKEVRAVVEALREIDRRSRLERSLEGQAADLLVSLSGLDPNLRKWPRYVRFAEEPTEYSLIKMMPVWEIEASIFWKHVR